MNDLYLFIEKFNPYNGSIEFFYNDNLNELVLSIEIDGVESKKVLPKEELKAIIDKLNFIYKNIEKDKR